jgi:hypothetical protein
LQTGANSVIGMIVTLIASILLPMA